MGRAGAFARGRRGVGSEPGLTADAFADLPTQVIGASSVPAAPGDRPILGSWRCSS